MKFSNEIKNNELHITIENELITFQCDMTELFDIAKSLMLPIVLDLKNVKSSGSALINALVNVKKETNLDISIINANEDILLLLEMVGLHNIMKIEGLHKSAYHYRPLESSLK